MAGKWLAYYADHRGRSPVLEFLERLAPQERKKAAGYLGYLRVSGEALRRPVAAYLGHAMYELRPKQIRILYAFVGPYAAILHAFRKTTGAIPDRELAVAQQRLVEMRVSYARGTLTAV